MLSANKLVGLMAEPERRRVVAALILSSGDLSYVTKTTGLDGREAMQALDRLTSAGLVEVGSDGVYVLLEETFKVAARTSRRQADPAEDKGQMSAADRVLEESIVDGRLIRFPRKRSKRLVVLDRLAQEFEPGVHYSEREANAVLRVFDPDVATMRRYLVDERFLDRSEGMYWRSGGTIETEP